MTAGSFDPAVWNKEKPAKKKGQHTMSDDKRQQENAMTEVDGKYAQQPGDALSRLDGIEIEINRRFEIQKRIMQIMVKHIDPAVDIAIIHDTPAKTSSFAHKLYRIIGGQFEYIKDDDGNPVVIRRNYEDENAERYYVYEAFGRYRPPFGDGGWYEASGSFSSRHKFFGKTEDGFKPLSAVDEQSVRQAALTECFKKCIFGGLGFGKLTPEMLEQWGIDTSKIDGYKFRQGSRGGSTDSENQRDVRAEIEVICRELVKEGWAPGPGEFPCSDAGDVLRCITKATYTKDGKEKHFAGYDSFERITKRSLNKTLEKVTAARDAWRKERDNAE